MKSSLYSLSLLLLYQGATAQSILNLRDRYDFPACTLTEALATDSRYYVTGVVDSGRVKQEPRHCQYFVTQKTT